MIIVIAIVTIILMLNAFRLARKYANWHTHPTIKKFHFTFFVLLLPAIVLIALCYLEEVKIEIPHSIQSFTSDRPKCSAGIAEMQKREYSSSFENFSNNNGSSSKEYTDAMDAQYGIGKTCWTEWDIRYAIADNIERSIFFNLIFVGFPYAGYVIVVLIFFPMNCLKNNSLTDVEREQIEIFGGHINDYEQLEQNVDPHRRPDDTSFKRVGLDSYLKNKDDPELVLGPTDITRIENLENLFYKELEEEWVAEGHYYEITPDIEIQHEQSHEFWEDIRSSNKKHYKKKKLVPISVALEKDGKRYGRFEHFPVFFYGWRFNDEPYRIKAKLMAIARVFNLSEEETKKFVNGKKLCVN